MKSKVTLYYNSLVTQEKNFLLDNFDGENTIKDYLDTLTKIEIDNFQYIKNQLSLTIKVNMNQANLEMIDTKDLNYIMIQNFNVVNETRVYEKSYFYFVVNKVWKAKDTIELVLVMDTLNSFEFNTDYQISQKSKITREHKDRFNKITKVSVSTGYIRSGEDEGDVFLISGDMKTTDITILSVSVEDHAPSDYEYGTYKSGDNIYFYVRLGGLASQDYGIEVQWSIKMIQPVVDFYNEGITPPLYKKSKNELIPPEKSVWYLIYETNTQATLDDPQPLNCYLIPEESLQVYVTQENTFLPSDLEDGKYYVFVSSFTENPITLLFADGQVTTNAYIAGLGEIQHYGFSLKKDGANIEIRTWVWKNGVVASIPYATLTAMATYTKPQVFFSSLDSPIKYYKGDSVPTNIETILPNRNQNLTRTNSSAPLIGINDYDKSNVLLNKIIALPYLPVPYNFDESLKTLVFDDTWEYEPVRRMMKLKDLNTKFKSNIKTEVVSPLKEFMTPRFNALDTNADRDMSLESKLKHSQFYYSKFTYDSFAFIFKAECINTANYRSLEDNKFEFTFVMTTTMNSRFLFHFEDYILLYSTEDFDNILNIARNNEETIYSSAYLNYLRTSYNYDVKAKERTITTSIIGGSLGVVAQGAGMALGFASGNPAIAVRGAISGGASIVNTIMSSINNVLSAEENFQKNLDVLKHQSVSVSGADDIDLMKYYSNNRGWLLEYEVSPRIKELLFNLFYYCGYKTEEQKIPEVNTRYWFNFLQASLIINESSNIPVDIEDDIKEKFEQGVTFLHKHSNVFDFSQEMENWETSLLE